MCSDPCARRPPLHSETGHGGVDSSPRQERVNFTLIANAVLPTDEVMKAVG